MKLETQFSEIKLLITQARNKTFFAVNSELVALYWKVGEYVSNKLKHSLWGDGVVEQLSDYLKQQDPYLKGFNKRGIYQMVQFYDTYSNPNFIEILPSEINSKSIVGLAMTQSQTTNNQCDNIASSVMAQLSWTHHIEILSSCKTSEEKLFYILMCKKERWSVRDLRRQIKTSFFERTMIANEKITFIQNKIPQNLTNIFRDSYILEFLNLPEIHTESTLRKSLIKNLKAFMCELGNDFLFLKEEFKISVGMQDFFIDLLFYHRDLQCLVAFELKTEKFTPQSLTQINFYLEALDRDIKKPHENPSIGILLCKGKDDLVVEYALSRTLNPAMIADYQTKLPDKQLIHDKWQEVLELSENIENEK